MPSLRGALATKQSIRSFCRAMDCFAALAMTASRPTLFLNERQQRAVGSRRRDADRTRAANTCAAGRLLRRGKVRGCDHEAGAAAFRQSGERNFRIAL